MAKIKKQKLAEGIQCWYMDRFKCEVIKKYKHIKDINKYWEIKLITDAGRKYSDNNNLIVPENMLSFEKKEHDIIVLYDKYKGLED